MFKYVITTILLLAWVLSAYNAEAKVVDEHIYLVPAGNVDKKVVEAIKAALPSNMPMSVRIEVSPQENILESAYDPSRQQYDADMILKDISRRTNLDVRVDSALVITGVDLYSPGSDFVLGISDKSKMIGLISLARLKNEFYGQKPDDKLFLQRAIKEASGQLGHVWGLSNCANQKCVMCFSGNLSDMDKKKNFFCHDCKMKLRERYIAPLIKRKQ